MPGEPCRIVVLISGNGSNLQAIIDAIAKEDIPAEIAAVISNKAEAFGLQRAQLAGIPTRILSYADYQDRDKYDRALMDAIDSVKPDLIVLAGFMRILTDAFVNHYLGKMINIHPSLLPRHKGLHTHQRVLQDGDKVHGATVHFVTPELDSGPLILQGKTQVTAADTEQTLIQRVHAIEHHIYPQVVKWFASGRLTLSNDKVLLDQKPIDLEGQIYTLQ